MGNQANRDAIRAYMREHDVNYTTAKRALDPPAGAPDSSAVHRRLGGSAYPIGLTPEGVPVGASSRGNGHTLITGDRGCGKTRLASQIAQGMLAKGAEVVVVSGRPEEYDGLPSDVRRHPKQPVDAASGTKSAMGDALRLLEEVTYEVQRGDDGSHLMLVVDGLNTREEGTVDERARQQIADILRAQVSGISLVVTAEIDPSGAPAVSGGLSAFDNTVVMRLPEGTDLDGLGAEVTRRSRDLNNGEALLVNAEAPDGTKITGTSDLDALLLPESLPFPEEGTTKCEQWHEAFREGKVAIGVNASADDVIIDLNNATIVLVAGPTGTGKTTLIRLLGYGALRNRDVCDVFATEGAGPGLATEMTRRNHGPAVTYSAAEEAEDSGAHESHRLRETADLTRRAVEEMISRQSLLRAHDVGTIGELRRRIRDGSTTGISLAEVPKRLLLLFDEVGAALTPTTSQAGKEMQDMVRRDLESIAMLARPVEINLVMTAQQPSMSNIGNGLITNTDTRVALGGSEPGEVFANVVRVLGARGHAPAVAPERALSVTSSLRSTRHGGGYLHSADPKCRGGLFRVCHLPASRLTPEASD